MAAYEYKFPDMYPVPAQTVGEFCEELQHSDDGLTPQSFVEASRSPDAPTHNMLEWRDEVAAARYREVQAQAIIRSIVIVTVEDNEVKKDRGFVITPGGKSAYVALQSALTKEEWRAHLLEQAKRDMEAFRAKYGRIAELAAVAERSRPTMRV